MSKQTVKGLWRRIFGALLTLSMLASLMQSFSLLEFGIKEFWIILSNR